MRIILPFLILMAPTAMAAAPWQDFAEIEAQGKCPQIVASATDAQTLTTWNQEQLDQLYACLKAGPIPDGFLNGTVIFAPGGGFDQFVTFANGIGFPIDKNALKDFAMSLWKGKQFYKSDRALLNKMGPNVKPLLGVDIKGQMRFPAKLFCGQSLLDGRRESVVIDYAFTDTVKIGGQTPYNDAIDWIAGGKTQTGRRGLNIRDEIRMVKPGFYLGRAYTDHVFLLNFTLTTDQPISGDDTCWQGYASAN